MGLRKKSTRPGLGISLRWFQDLVSYHMRNRIRAVHPGEITPWRHHWHTTLQWSEERGIWTAQMEPGFCESDAPDPRPHYTMEARHAPAVTRQRLELPEDSEELVEVPLTEDPALDLPEALWRPVGTEAVASSEHPAEAVPRYFQLRGVADPIQLRESATGGIQQVVSGDLEERAKARLLRAMDIIIRHRRARTVSDFILEPGGVVSLEMGIEPPPQPVRHATIHRVEKWEPFPDFGPVQAIRNPLADEGVDEELLCTVYLMSERGLPPGSPIDARWIPVVKHFRFWPLQYRERWQKGNLEPYRVEFNGLGLGLGTLNQLADRIAAERNQQIADLEALFRTARAEGRFFFAA